MVASSLRDQGFLRWFEPSTVPLFRGITMKKIGIIFTGESYGKNQGVCGSNRDWTLSKDNIKRTVIDSFKETYNVKIYFTTYYHPFIGDMIEFYNPSKMLLLSKEGSHQRTTYIESMKSLLNEDLDFIVATRCDLKYAKPLINFNFDFDKFNFACREIEPYWSNYKFVNDCVFGIPKKYLEQFILSIQLEHASPIRGCPDLHNVYRYIISQIGEDNVHFLIDGCFSSSAVPQIYDIIRA